MGAQVMGACAQVISFEALPVDTDVNPFTSFQMLLQPQQRCIARAIYCISHPTHSTSHPIHCSIGELMAALSAMLSAMQSAMFGGRAPHLSPALAPVTVSSSVT